MPPHLRNRFLFVTGIVLGVCAMVWILWRTDWQSFVEILSNANWQYLPGIAVVVVLEQGLRAVKWRLLLRDVKMLNIFATFNAIMAGFAAGVIIPVGISPLVRSWLVARHAGINTMTVLASAMVDRLIDAMVFVLFALLALSVYTVPADSDGLLTKLYIVIAANLVLLPCIGWLFYRMRHDVQSGKGLIQTFIQRCSGMLPQRVRETADNAIRQLSAGFILPQSRVHQVLIVATTLLMRVTNLGLFVFAGLAVGVQFTLPQLLFLIVIPGFSYALSRVARIPGGFILGGVIGLTMLGHNNETALALMMLIHLTTAVVVMAIGVPVLINRSITITDLRANLRRDNAQEPQPDRQVQNAGPMTVDDQGTDSQVIVSVTTVKPDRG